jgi:response regulator RpfG family c-di-GMP phosphodiesterase
MPEKILMVDDEDAVLVGYQRMFRNEFQIDTAPGGAAAVTALETTGPYAVVVSDMRMPEMDGTQLLRKVKVIAPDAVRIMLTGDADVRSAVSAVNEGSIFRFLTKPCNKDTLGKALTAGLMQHRLLTAEKDLLENTLQGSIQVLTEVLSLVNPTAFGRALRVRRYTHHVATKMALASPWRFEVAAMMSQLGCVTLHPETIEAVYAGRKLPPDEQKRFDAHPGVARDLLSKIPRMEPIAWMIAHQNDSAAAGATTGGDSAKLATADMRLGSNLLQATLAFDELVSKGLSQAEAASRLSREHTSFDPRIFEALAQLDGEKKGTEVRSCDVDELIPYDMVLEEELRTKTGMLLVSKGQDITPTLILKLKNFLEKGAIGRKVAISAKNRAKAATA